MGKSGGDDDEAKPGYRFEREVAGLYRILGATVSHDFLLAGLQVDVYLEEGTPSGLLRTVVECKDTKKRVGSPIVKSFAENARLWRGSNLADKFVLVSRFGFTAPAREAAAKFGIGLVEYADLQAKVNREIAAHDAYIWTEEDIERGLALAEDEAGTAPIPPGEGRQRGASSRKPHTGPLSRVQAVEECGRWSTAKQRKRGGSRVQVLWLVGDEAPTGAKHF